MAEQTVTYLIGKDGKITVEVNGVRGSACRELVRETIEKLGVYLMNGRENGTPDSLA